MSRARIQSTSTDSMTSPPAKATIICTTSTSVADNSFSFNFGNFGDSALIAPE